MLLRRWTIDLQLLQSCIFHGTLVNYVDDLTVRVSIAAAYLHEMTSLNLGDNFTIEALK